MKSATLTTLASVLADAKHLVEKLLTASCSPISKIPKTQGVYVIYGKEGDTVYVGKGKNLRRRICDDHCGGDERMSTSTFRRSIHKVLGVPAGRPLRDWVRENCSFAFIEIPDPDLCAAVEALTIRVLRQSGHKLLNA